MTIVQLKKLQKLRKLLESGEANSKDIRALSELLTSINLRDENGSVGESELAYQPIYF